MLVVCKDPQAIISVSTSIHFVTNNYDRRACKSDNHPEDLATEGQESICALNNIVELNPPGSASNIPLHHIV